MGRRYGDGGACGLILESQPTCSLRRTTDRGSGRDRASMRSTTTTPTTTPDVGPGPGRRRRTAGRLLGQGALLAGAAATYFSVRSLTEGDRDSALENAQRVLDVERALGLDVEVALQAAVLPVEPLVVLANWVYVFGHWPVLIGVLVWLALRHPLRFVELRDALLLSGAVGMVVFALFPVAPPRLVDEGELAVMVDTVLERSQAYRVLQPPAFTNQYAAVPSLHVGWDLLAGIAVARTAQRAWVRALGAVLPVLMVLSVVVTANHFVLDAIAGAALSVACLTVVQARMPRRAQRQAARPGAARPDVGARASAPRSPQPRPPVAYP